MPVIRSVLFTNVIHDLLFLIPFVILVLIIILIYSLRDLTGVRITGIVIGGSVLFTVGLMSWLNIPIKIVTSSLPVILVSIACADSIHLITKYHDFISLGHSKIESVYIMLDKLLLPVIVTSITTIAGFLSLTTAVLPALRTYGIFISIGVLWALLLSIFVLPSFLILSKIPEFHKENKKHILNKGLYTLSKYILKNRKAVIVFFIILIIISFWDIRIINVEMNPETFFPHSSVVRKDSNFLNKYFSGSVSLNIMIQGDIKSPKVLNNMLFIQKYVEKKQIVGNVRSIANIIKKLHKIFYLDNDKYDVIPKTRDKIAQLLLLYSMSGDASDFDKYVTYDYKTAVIDIKIKSSSTKKIKAFVADVNKFIRERSFKNMKVYLTGSSVFFSELVYMLIKSCLISIFVSLILVFIIVWVSFKSLKLGLFAIIPLFVAVTVDFGLMGIIGIDLNHVTAMLSAIAIGVGIDYSIHYIASYIQSLKMNLTESERLTYLITTTGKPILFNAFSVAAGFSILLFSSFLPIKFLGGLIALSMISCALGALTILAILLYEAPKNIK